MPKLFKRDRASYLRSYHRRYRVLNKQKIKEAQKVYRQKNKSRLRIKRKECYERNKERYKENAKAKIRCDVCNAEMIYNSQFQHRKSTKHIKVLVEKGTEGVVEKGMMNSTPALIEPIEPIRHIKSEKKVEKKMKPKPKDNILRDLLNSLTHEIINTDDDFEPIENRQSSPQGGSFRRSPEGYPLDASLRYVNEGSLQLSRPQSVQPYAYENNQESGNSVPYHLKPLMSWNSKGDVEVLFEPPVQSYGLPRHPF